MDSMEEGRGRGCKYGREGGDEGVESDGEGGRYSWDGIDEGGRRSGFGGGGGELRVY